MPDKLIKISKDGLEIMKPGDTVLFSSHDTSRTRKGIIKSIEDDEHAFVVYECEGEWLNYRDYAAEKTNIKQLVLGWGW